MKSQLVDVKQRNVIKYDKRTDIYTNGADNAYPTRMERIINSSITARSCALMYQLFMFGTGFKVDKSFIVGKYQAKGISANQLLKLITRDLSYHNGVFLHINYNLLGEITSICPLMFKNCRFGKQDSEEYSGKIVYYNNWDLTTGSRVLTKDFKCFDVYNPNKEVIAYQIEKAGGIAKYNGQVAFLTFDDYGIYPLAPIDPGQDDADTEYQFSVFKNRTLSRGFLGKKIITHSPFESDEDKKAFKQSVQNIQGVDSLNDILLIETAYNSDDKLENVSVKPLNDFSNFARDYGSWEESVSNNIRKCFKFIPPVLIDYVEGKLGNTSGESFLMAQKFYNAQTRMERGILTEFLEGLFKNFYQQFNNDWTIDELYLMDEKISDANELIKNAQAELRGSVGGVTSLLAIQQSVAAGTTDNESGVQMLMNIYGYSEDVARKMLGTPKENTQPQPA